MTLKIFGKYKVREKKEVDSKIINQVDKEYDWLDIMIRIVIYILILVPLLILATINLIGIIGTSYLVARGIKMIGVPIMLAGLFGLLVSLIATIRDSLNHNRRSYLLAIFVTIIIFIVGI